MDPARQPIEFLFDFIYLNRPKLASYSAQLFDDGVLTSLKNTKQIQESKGAKFAGNAVVAKADIHGQESNQESSEWLYDSSWSVPLNVIDRLDEEGFILRNLSQAAIGQMVLVQGKVQVLDVRMLKRMWKPALGFLQLQLPRTSKQKVEQQKQEQNLRALFEVVEQIQDVSLLLLDMGDEQAWMTLPVEHMIINADDLAMKHGARVMGEWYVLAVLDAKPEGEETGAMEEVHDDSETMNQKMFVAMRQMSNVIRTIIGRPASAYGLTPVAIFRKVSKSA